MLILMQNYGLFTKFVVLQEPGSKETKSVRKAVEKTKEGKSCLDNFTIFATKHKEMIEIFRNNFTNVATNQKAN